jgi:site-specific recombinase XerD
MSPSNPVTSLADNPEHQRGAHPLRMSEAEVVQRSSAPGLPTGVPRPEGLLTLDRLDAQFRAFLEYAATVKNHSDQTLSWYRGSYSNYRKYLLATTELPVDAFTQRAFDLDDWIRWNHHRRIEGVTMNAYWRGVRAFFTDWEHRGAGPNPFRGARAPKVRSYVPKALAHDDCVRIMATARNYPWPTPFERALALAVLGVMLYAGLRVGEVRRLLVADVDLREGTIRITRGKGQGGGKDRTAYIAPELVALLRDYVQERFRRSDGRQPAEFFMTAVTGRGIGIFTVTHIIRRVRVASGIAFSAHVLRHSFVTHLIRSGAPIHVVRDLAGHASISTTIGYLNVFDEDRRATLQRLQFLATSGPGRSRTRSV